MVKVEEMAKQQSEACDKYEVCKRNPAKTRERKILKAKVIPRPEFDLFRTH